MPMPQPSSVIGLQAAAPMISACMDEQSQCEQRYAGCFFGIGCQQAMDVAHFLSAGIVSFARGLNDTPKMAALLLVLPELDARSSLVTVAVAIAVGGLLNARRVAESMSHKITGMNHGQGFSANLATGVRSYQRVYSDYLCPQRTYRLGRSSGIGLTSRQANFRVIRNILLSWLLTLPCAAVIGALVYWFTKH